MYSLVTPCRIIAKNIVPQREFHIKQAMGKALIFRYNPAWGNQRIHLRVYNNK